jgi:maltooligosyltrehalose trehalohydrolase
VIRPRGAGGYGLDAQFNDDFHHALHSLLTGENQGYYADFGRVDDLATAYRQGFVYDWRYSSYRRRHHGSSSADRPARQLPVFIQNHDQVGNRRRGERLVTLVGFEKAKLAAAAVLLSPYIPLLFMGEEYAERAPFLYFTDFSDPDLVEAVRKGRKEEFRGFAWEEEPPDPHDPEVFSRSKLNWSLRDHAPHRVMWDLYRRLLELRRDIPALAFPERQQFRVGGEEKERVLWFRRGREASQILCLMNFGEQTVIRPLPEREGRKKWLKVLDTADAEWLGPGSGPAPARTCEGDPVTLTPWSCHLYQG